MAIALVPGSFDPVHNGHLEIIERVAAHFDEVIVAIVRNPQKDAEMFTLDERHEMLSDLTAHLPNIRLDSFEGLLVDFAAEHGVTVIVKGLRTPSDFEYEVAQAQMNRALSGIDTLFMPCNPGTSYIASKLVREVARLGGDVTAMVPEAVKKRLAARFGE